MAGRVEITDAAEGEEAAATDVPAAKVDDAAAPDAAE